MRYIYNSYVLRVNTSFISIVKFQFTKETTYLRKVFFTNGLFIFAFSRACNAFLFGFLKIFLYETFQVLYLNALYLLLVFIKNLED